MRVVRLDDYDAVLGMELLHARWLLPYLEGVQVLHEKAAGWIQCGACGTMAGTPMVERESSDASVFGASQVSATPISAWTLATGVRRGETTYIAVVATTELTPSAWEVPTPIIDVLQEFQDLIPEELPKGLPPRHKVDHRIELVTGVVPPARPPYHMVPMELQELRRQLDGLIDADFIRPLTSPYGAAVLFQRKHSTLRMCIDYRALNWVTV